MLLYMVQATLQPNLVKLQNTIFENEGSTLMTKITKKQIKGESRYRYSINPFFPMIINIFSFSSFTFLIKMITMVFIKEHIIVLLALAICLSTQQNFTLQLLPTERGARCLDGSPAGFQYHKGTAPNDKKFIIYMDSGGFCGGFTLEEALESCYQRSKTGLGTTTKYPPSKNLDDLGLLSTDPKRNPVFHDWTKIFLIYCDGSEYTGNKTDPISYKDRDLYFRGHSNVLQFFRFMDQKFDFYNGDKIVLTGVSAGGMGTYFYSTYLYDHTKKAQVLAIPDSGLFLVDYVTPLAGKPIIKLFGEPLIKMVNVQQRGFPYEKCIEDNKDDILECYTTSNLTQFFKAPMLIVESPYDSYSIQRIIYTECQSNRKQPYTIQNCNKTQRDAIEQYRLEIIEALRKMRGDRKDIGLWGPVCAQHGFSDTDTFTDTNFRVPSGTGPMVSEAIKQFIDDPYNAPWYLDENPWPSNAGCSGISTKNLQVE